MNWLAASGATITATLGAVAFMATFPPPQSPYLAFFWMAFVIVTFWRMAYRAMRS